MTVSFYEDINLSDLPSVFLAGPTIRNGKFEESWRSEAVKIFEELGFDGNLYVPESKTGVYPDSLRKTAYWEWDRLESSKAILFWIPRDLDLLPGFTTNTEFGRYITLCPENVMLGYPVNAPKNSYIGLMYERFNPTPIYHDLRELIKGTIEKVGKDT